MYNLNRMRLLREVSVRGTLAAAAQALGYNPSSVSHQLKLLEQEVGAQLLEPVGRKVKLTREAQILVRHTEQILLQLESARSEVARAAAEVQGTVRIACFQTAAHTAVPAALRQLAESHPGLRIEVSHIPVEQALPALLARDFDLVLQEDYPGHPQRALPGAEIKPVGSDNLWLLAPSGEVPGELANLSGRRWIMEPSGTLARQWATSACRHAGFEPDVVIETSDVMLQVGYVRAGLGVALVPGLALTASRREGLSWHYLQGRPARRLSIAVRSGSRRSPAIEAVQQALADGLTAQLVEHAPTAATGNRSGGAG